VKEQIVSNAATDDGRKRAGVVKTGAVGAGAAVLLAIGIPRIAEGPAPAGATSAEVFSEEAYMNLMRAANTYVQQNGTTCAGGGVGYTAAKFAAISMTTAWYETLGYTYAAPSPSAVGRSDTPFLGSPDNTNLYRDNDVYTSDPQAYWHAHNGMYALDNIETGSLNNLDFPEWYQMNSYDSSTLMVAFLADRYCNANGSLQAMWDNVWYACDKDKYTDAGLNHFTRCNTTYLSIYDAATDSISITKDQSVGGNDGLEKKQCSYFNFSAKFDCWEINRDNMTGDMLYSGSNYDPNGTYVPGSNDNGVSPWHRRTSSFSDGLKIRQYYANWYTSSPFVMASRNPGQNPRVSTKWSDAPVQLCLWLGNYPYCQTPV